MSIPAYEAVLSGLVGKAVEIARASLGDVWDSFSDQERADCERLLTSIARAHLCELAGEDVSEEKQILEAAFLQWKVVGKQFAISAVQAAATQVFGYAGAFAGSAIAAVVKSAI